MGHLSNMCLCGLGSEFSCRLCYCRRRDLQNPYINNFAPRTGIEEALMLENAFEIFCASILPNAVLSDDDKYVLQYCEERCIYPIKPAFMDVSLPFDGFSYYDYLRLGLVRISFPRLGSTPGTIRSRSERTPPGWARLHERSERTA